MDLVDNRFNNKCPMRRCDIIFFKYKRRFRLYLLILLTIVLTTGCIVKSPSSSEESLAIALVQNSKKSYGRLFDVLNLTGLNHIIQKMPNYKDAIDSTLSHPKWSSEKGKDSTIYVYLLGGGDVLGNYVEYAFQWVIRGDLHSNTAQAYLDGFLINRVAQTVGMYDLFSVTMLYQLGVLTNSELAEVSLYMIINNELFK